MPLALQARENLDPCGRVPAVDQPQNWRKASSTRKRAMRSRVVGRLKMAFAMKAVAKPARSLADRWPPPAATRARPTESVT